MTGLGLGLWAHAPETDQAQKPGRPTHSRRGRGGSAACARPGAGVRGVAPRRARARRRCARCWRRASAAARRARRPPPPGPRRTRPAGARAPRARAARPGSPASTPGPPARPRPARRARRSSLSGRHSESMFREHEYADPVHTPYTCPTRPIPARLSSASTAQIHIRRGAPPARARRARSLPARSSGAHAARPLALRQRPARRRGGAAAHRDGLQDAAQRGRVAALHRARDRLRQRAQVREAAAVAGARVQRPARRAQRDRALAHVLKERDQVLHDCAARRARGSGVSRAGARRGAGPACSTAPRPEVRRPTFGCPAKKFRVRCRCKCHCALPEQPYNSRLKCAVEPLQRPALFRAPCVRPQRRKRIALLVHKRTEPNRVTHPT